MLLYFSISLFNGAGDIPFTSFIICSKSSVQIYPLFFTVSFKINDNFPVVPASSIYKGRSGFFLLSESVRTVPDDPLIMAPGNYSRFFSLTRTALYSGDFSNVFHQSDFETKFATTGMRFILNRSIMVRMNRVDKKCTSGKGVETK